MTQIRTSGIWSQLPALVPTRQAAVALSLSGSGDGSSTFKPGVAHWKAPPAMLSWRTSARSCVDLTGHQGGLLTVVGILALRPGDGKWAPLRWVVRCACGDYEIRRHEKISKGLAPDAACAECRHTMQMRARGSQASTGRRRKAEEGRLDDMAARARGAAAGG